MLRWLLNPHVKNTDTKNSYSVKLYAEQVKLLYKNAPLAYSTALINGAILAFVQGTSIIPFSTSVSWYACLLLVTMCRALIVWRYKKATPEFTHTQSWHSLYLIGVAVSGIVWGSAAFVLFPRDLVANQAFVAFVLAGMSAGGISVLAPRLEACFIFLVPTLLPLAGRYLVLGTRLQTAMGIMTLIFLIALLVSAWNLHRDIRTSLILRFDKRELEAEVEQRRHAEEALFREKDRLQTTLSSIGEGVALIDANGHIEYLNPAAERLCGWRSHSAQHRPVNEVFVNIDVHNQRTATAMEDSLLSGRQVAKQTTLFCSGGASHRIEELATALYDRHGQIMGVVSVFRDVTEAIQKTEQLAYAATHDPLTGLPNRDLLKDRTKQAIARAQRKHENFALLFLDLDSFKLVNDNMGHVFGDMLLVNVAERLTNSVREEDTVARLGGDEFVVLLDGPTQEYQVTTIADKILQALRKPFRFGAAATTITASIGSSFYPDDGLDSETLLIHADTAMYHAKQRGRNQHSAA